MSETSITVTGKLIHVSDLKTGTGKNGKDWQNLQIVLETQEQYPKKVPIDILKSDLIEKITGYEMGQLLTVHVNLDGREHNGNWYAKITGWKL